MLREIITYPDKRLFTKSQEVLEFDKELHTLLDDMYETMIARNGIGLAAIQVAISKRALIINLLNDDELQDKADLLEVINPKIIEKSGETIFTEGCLSVPGYYEEVQRFEKITAKFQDRFGNEITQEMDGLLAIALQHEMDHLDGHLFIEKLSYTKRKKFEKEFKKRLKAAS